MKLLLRGGEAAFFVFVNQVRVAQADFIFYFCSVMKGLGKGVKSFKDGVNGVEDDLKADAKKDDSSQSKEK